MHSVRLCAQETGEQAQFTVHKTAVLARTNDVFNYTVRDSSHILSRSKPTKDVGLLTPILRPSLDIGRFTVRKFDQTEAL